MGFHGEVKVVYTLFIPPCMIVRYLFPSFLPITGSELRGKSFLMRYAANVPMSSVFSASFAYTGRFELLHCMQANNMPARTM